MHKRHWDFVAQTIKEAREGKSRVEDLALSSLVWLFADKFKQDNSKFDMEKFYATTIEGVRRIGK